MAYYKKPTKDPNQPSAEERAIGKIADSIINLLETMKGAEWKKPWFTNGAGSKFGFPVSLDGRAYKGGFNIFLLAIRAQANGWNPVFGTSKAIHDYNFKKDASGNLVPATDKEGNKLPFVHILKGEQSTPVTFPYMRAFDKEDHTKSITLPEYHKLSEQDKEKYYVRFVSEITYDVFSVDQTNLKQARPELYEKLTAPYKEPEQAENTQPTEQNELDPNVRRALDLYTEMISKDLWIAPIELRHQDQAYYVPGTHNIVLPELKQFYNPAAFIGTASHEMVHSTGNENWLKRDLTGTWGTDKYRNEEVIAEFGKAIVSFNFGLNEDVKEDSIPYLEGYLNHLKKDPQYIKELIKPVNQATDLILGRLGKIELAMQEAKENGVEPDYSAIHKENNDHNFKIATEEVKKQTIVRSLGTYALSGETLSYMETGERGSLTDKQVEAIDDFVKNHFPKGEIHNVVADINSSEHAAIPEDRKPGETMKLVAFYDPTTRDIIADRVKLPSFNIEVGNEIDKAVVSYNKDNGNLQLLPQLKDGNEVKKPISFTPIMEIIYDGTRSFEENVDDLVSRYSFNLKQKYSAALNYINEGKIEPSLTEGIKRFIDVSNSQEGTLDKQFRAFISEPLEARLVPSLKGRIGLMLNLENGNQYFVGVKNNDSQNNSSKVTNSELYAAVKTNEGLKEVFTLPYETKEVPLAAMSDIKDAINTLPENNDTLDVESRLTILPIKYMNLSDKKVVSIENEMVDAVIKNLRSNMLQADNGDVLYIGYDKEKNQLYAGSATNAGIIREYTKNYDHEEAFDSNIETFSEDVLNAYNTKIREEINEQQDEKVSRGIGR